jgi:hypothetical protein
MKLRHAAAPVVLAVAALSLFGQEPLTNETIGKLVKAGLGETVILSMISSQPGRYSTSAQDVLALKELGASDKIIAAIIARPAAGTPSGATQPQEPQGSNLSISEIGVYSRNGEKWVEVMPEIVNWKTGGTLKSLASAGVIKKDVNGFLTNSNSRHVLKSPMEFLIYMPEGVAITEYQLLRLRQNKDYREFRTVTGGVFNQKGGAMRDLVAFEGKKVAARTYSIVLQGTLGPGEYGFLPPGALPSGSTHANLGKMYTFRLLE